MPFFRAEDDPGPDFSALVRRAGLEPPQMDRHGDAVTLTHGTTVVALRYADGVVMAGDRRATVGQPHQPPDDGEGVPRRPPFSGVAIAGAAGPAVEMVKLFQLQLEHYEKVEGDAAQPGGQGQPARPDGAQQPARGHAGPRRRAALRRLRPAPRHRAACSSTTSPAAATRRTTTPPPARAACTPAPSSSSGCRDELTRDEAVDLAMQGAVPGRRRGLRHRRPRPGAGDLPGRGHHHRRGLRPRSSDDELAERFRACSIAGRRPTHERTGARDHRPSGGLRP